MRNYAEALQAFFSSLGLPVYLQGKIPREASFPYVTYTPKQGDGLTTGQQLFFAFFKREDNADAFVQRAEFIESVKQMIPHEGVKIEYEKGRVVAERANNSFWTYFDDPTDRSILGVRFALNMRYFE